MGAYVCGYGHLHTCVFATVDIGIHTQTHKQIHLSLIITQFPPGEKSNRHKGIKEQLRTQLSVTNGINIKVHKWARLAV